MGLSIDQTRRIEIIEHPILLNFNAEFGTESDLSRYENIRTQVRAVSQEVIYLNQLQMGGYIPCNKALLLKNNLHDIPFITFTIRSILYDLKQRGKMGEACFNFLHEKLNKNDFTSVYQYLYILMLYTQIAEKHDAQVMDATFRFQSPSQYSEKLIKSSIYVVQKEEQYLERRYRNQFLKQWLSELGSKSTCPRNAQKEIFNILSAIDTSDDEKFRHHFLILLEQLQEEAELEKICWQELQSILTPFSGNGFFHQAYLCLRTEDYYKSCLQRVTTLQQSLERTNPADLLALSERCKKAYNGCVYLLQDSKNMPASSPMRFAALTGKMRTEWQAINNVFSRAEQQLIHRMCSCQVQTPPSRNEMAEWPFTPPSLIPLNPSPPIVLAQLEPRGVNAEVFRENSKKTIAILGCKWGGGHMEIARGICNNLTSLGYHTVSVDLPEVLMSQDPIHNFFLTRWLGKNWSTATLYVGLIQEKAFAMINFLRWINSKFFSSEGYTDVQLKLVIHELLKINPDAVIVDYSAHNEAVIKACEILGIPCLHVGADINNVIETRSHPPTYSHFKMALPFNIPEVVNTVEKTTTEFQRVFTGPPVKHEFTLTRTPEDIQRLKQQWGISLDKKVVIIANGLAGGSSPYPEILAKKYATTNPDDIPIHLVVLCGKNNPQFKRHLEQNVIPKTNLPMTVELHTPKMEELMAMASYGGVLIGKAGTTTIFESIVRGTRLLIDNVPPRFFSQGVKHFLVTCLEMFLRKLGFKGQIFWEKDNADFTKKHGLADTFKHEEEFLPKLEQMLNNDQRPVHLHLELKNVEREIPLVLRDMLVRAQVDLNTKRARETHRNL